MPAIDPASLYIQLGRLVETMPDLTGPYPLPSTSQQWLGRAGALVQAGGDAIDIALFKTAVSSLSNPTFRFSSAQDVATVVHRALAMAEMRAPAAVQGAFIPAGNAFDALAAVAKVLGSATRDLLIVDPYMDEKTLTDFAPLAPEHVAVRLLADHQHHKPTLAPAQQRWGTQFGATRPLTVKLAPSRGLHDRLIIVDGTQAWVLTQSLNALAARSPASIVRVDNETAALKVAAYEEIWNSATAM